jgi:hypothetical protein
MPSQAALERGSAVARDILEGHREANGGAWPETVAVRISVPHASACTVNGNSIKTGGRGGAIDIEHCAYGDRVLLGSGKSNMGLEFGSLYMQLACRHTVPFWQEAVLLCQ